jgi:tRNA-(ms[2]io[6]A)-hydroxylase
VDHAFLEKKAAANAMELMTRFPDDSIWITAMTAVARDEAAHLARVTRLLVRRGGRLMREHKNPYASELRLLVRKGLKGEILDRLLVSALIEARSCERFSVLAEASSDCELAKLYGGLFRSEHGHFRVFLRLGARIVAEADVQKRWSELVAAEADVLARQPLGPRIHSGVP